MARPDNSAREPDGGKRLGIDLALVHYPVLNKNGETIGSAVTNLDIHDIARAARTFGVENFYIITPVVDQQRLTREILDHWLAGPGAIYNAKRKEALALVRICSSLEEVLALVTAKRGGAKPLVLATGARNREVVRSYESARQRGLEGQGLLILFGTAWGLAPEVFEMVDASLPPISGPDEYNHLSVRAAAAIVLDRLLGNRK